MSRELRQLLIRIAVRDDGTRQEVEKINASLSRIAGTAAKVGAGFVGAGAAIAGGTAALAAFASRGGDVFQVQQAFARGTGDMAYGLEALRQATGGVVSDFALMKTANSALATGLASTVTELAEVAAVATPLANILGRDVTQSIEELTKALATGQKRALTNLGIIIDTTEAHQKYADSVGKTVAQLTAAEKQDAFRQAALEAGRKVIQDMGGAHDTAGESVQRFRAQLANLKDELSLMVAESPRVIGYFETLAGGIEKLLGGNRFARMELRDIAGVPDNADALVARLRVSIEEADRLRGRLGELQAQYERVRNSAIPIVPGLKETEQELDGVLKGIDTLQRRLNVLARPRPARGGGENDPEVGVGVRNRVVEINTALQQQLRVATQLNELLPGLYDGLPPQVAAYRAALQALIAEGVDPTSEAVRQVVAELDRLSRALRKLDNLNVQIGLAGPANLVDPFGSAVRGAAPVTANLTPPPTLPRAEISSFARALDAGEGAVRQFADGVSSAFSGAFDLRSIGSNLAAQGIGLAISEITRAFRESPEQRELARSLQQNAAAVIRLSRTFEAQAAFISDTQGGEVALLLQAVAATLAQGEELGVRQLFDAQKVLALQAARLGLTLDEVKQYAAGFGIELNKSWQSIEDFQRALQQATTAAIANTFAGRSDLTRRRLDLLGIDDPGERLRAGLADILPFIKGELAETLRSLDFADMGDFVETLFADLMAGEFDIGQLSGLNLTQFLDWLAEMKGLAEAAGNAADGLNSVSGALRNVPEGFKVALERFRATEVADPVARLPRSDPGRIEDPPIQAGDIVFAGDIYINGEDGEEIYQQFQRRVQRDVSRGASSPLTALTIRPRSR
jgi:hypothetical protein